MEEQLSQQPVEKFAAPAKSNRVSRLTVIFIGLVMIFVGSLALYTFKLRAKQSTAKQSATLTQPTASPLIIPTPPPVAAVDTKSEGSKGDFTLTLKKDTSGVIASWDKNILVTQVRLSKMGADNKLTTVYTVSYPEGKDAMGVPFQAANPYTVKTTFEKSKQYILQLTAMRNNKVATGYYVFTY